MWDRAPCTELAWQYVPWWLRPGTCVRGPARRRGSAVAVSRVCVRSQTHEKPNLERFGGNTKTR
eukprot:2699645-Prymnesium_polylepis.1